MVDVVYPPRLYTKEYLPELYAKNGPAHRSSIRKGGPAHRSFMRRRAKSFSAELNVMKLPLKITNTDLFFLNIQPQNADKPYYSTEHKNFSSQFENKKSI
jgi:hypothetical protein